MQPASGWDQWTEAFTGYFSERFHDSFKKVWFSGQWDGAVQPISMS